MAADFKESQVQRTQGQHEGQIFTNSTYNSISQILQFYPNYLLEYNYFANLTNH